MAENTDEEHLDTQTNTLSEDLPDEIIPANDTEAINPNQETENMETHAHHLHHAPGKRIWHYFYEFLMLFLAVFCGFLAENFREHQVEKEKGLQYIRSFYNDLKTDTTEFAGLIDKYENKMNAFSKRNECFDSLSWQIKSFNPCIVELIRKCSSFPDFVNADQTLLQLKNAGGLRLLGQSDADSILDYDKQVRLFIKFETTGFQERQYQIRELMYSILNYKSQMLKNADPTIPVLITNEPEKINQFFVMLNEYAFACNSHLLSLKELNRKATGLINYFKNKYHYE